MLLWNLQSDIDWRFRSNPQNCSRNPQRAVLKNGGQHDAQPAVQEPAHCRPAHPPILGDEGKHLSPCRTSRPEAGAALSETPWPRLALRPTSSSASWTTVRCEQNIYRRAVAARLHETHAALPCSAWESLCTSWQLFCGVCSCSTCVTICQALPLLTL